MKHGDPTMVTPVEDYVLNRAMVSSHREYMRCLLDGKSNGKQEMYYDFQYTDCDVFGGALPGPARPD